MTVVVVLMMVTVVLKMVMMMMVVTVVMDDDVTVLTGIDGTVYLDSRQPPSDGDVVTVAGARFRYRRSTESGGSHSVVLRGRGPINDTVLVKVSRAPCLAQGT